MKVESARTSDYDSLSPQAGIIAHLSDRHQLQRRDSNNSAASPVPSLALTDRSSSTLNGGSSQQHQHSTLQKVIRGIGELDNYSQLPSKRGQQFERAEKRLMQLQQDLDLPYLLLDLRDRDDYEQCHMITALSYPVAMLSRSINNETPDMLAYKNQAGKIIVVYDDDERLGPKAATTLVQRGYDNLFLLSGGWTNLFISFFCFVSTSK